MPLVPPSPDRFAEWVELTCDETNVASARTIELDGGIYEDSRGGRRRYWISTGP